MPDRCLIIQCQCYWDIKCREVRRPAKVYPIGHFFDWTHPAHGTVVNQDGDASRNKAGRVSAVAPMPFTNSPPMGGAARQRVYVSRFGNLHQK